MKANKRKTITEELRDFMPYKTEETIHSFGPIRFSSTRLVSVDHTSLLKLIDDFKRRIPPSVKFHETHQEIYDARSGPHTRFSFVPDNPYAASLEIYLFDDPIEDGECHWAIDTRRMIETRTGIKPKVQRPWYLDCLLVNDRLNVQTPLSLAHQEELELVYQATSQGSIHLKAGIAFGQLCGVDEAYLALPSQHYKLRPCGFIWLTKLATFIGKGRIYTLCCEPW